uniref:HSR domain-containing protein n=1 Tax=Marmota marmota marmota TaxID=9994 RepID=A0A8C5YM49_MARMA
MRHPDSAVALNKQFSRTVSLDYNSEEQVLHEHLFRHFKENKVEIASAITKLFPFLMSLRDRAFISEQMFDHLQEACRNLVPVNAVVYTVLSELEKTFSLSLLNELFSNTNLTAYPDLVEISRSFLNGNKTRQKQQKKSCPNCNGPLNNQHREIRSVPVSCVSQEMCQEAQEQGRTAAKSMGCLLSNGIETMWSMFCRIYNLLL